MVAATSKSKTILLMLEYGLSQKIGLVLTGFSPRLIKSVCENNSSLFSYHNYYGIQNDNSRQEAAPAVARRVHRDVSASDQVHPPCHYTRSHDLWIARGCRRLVGYRRVVVVTKPCALA
jgi:hypothetical protein